MTILRTRKYLKKHKRFLKYTCIADACGIDKNVLKNFLDGKAGLKLSHQKNLVHFVRQMVESV